MSKTNPEVDLIIQGHPDWRGALLQEIRESILAAHPDIIETVKWKMPSKPLGSASFELNGILCVADLLKKAVRLTFAKGATISDPDCLFNCRTESKSARGIDYFTSDFDSKKLQGLVLQAIALNDSARKAKR